MNFTLLLEEDVRLGGQRENISYHRDGRWTRRKPRGSSLLDELANQQEGEEDDGHAAHPEQGLRAGHRHQRRRFNRNHLFSCLTTSADFHVLSEGLKHIWIILHVSIPRLQE